MDINFTAAIFLINMGKYESAVEYLKKAIAAKEGDGSMDVAIEYTCVLGELLANMGESERAREEFGKVAEYCKRTNSLAKQNEIAQNFISEYDAAGNSESVSRNGNKTGVQVYAKLPRSEKKPNTTQTSVFLQ